MGKGKSPFFFILESKNPLNILYIVKSIPLLSNRITATYAPAFYAFIVHASFIFSILYNYSRMHIYITAKTVSAFMQYTKYAQNMIISSFSDIWKSKLCYRNQSMVIGNF